VSAAQQPTPEITLEPSGPLQAVTAQNPQEPSASSPVSFANSPEPSVSLSESSANQLEPRMIGLDLDERFIIDGKRIRRPAPSKDAYFSYFKSRKQEYEESLQHLDKLPGFYSAFTAGLNHNRIGYYRTELPEPPKF